MGDDLSDFLSWPMRVGEGTCRLHGNDEGSFVFFRLSFDLNDEISASLLAAVPELEISESLQEKAEGRAGLVLTCSTCTHCRTADSMETIEWEVQNKYWWRLFFAAAALCLSYRASG